MVKFLRGQWKEFTSMVDPFSIMLMEGLLIVPVVMAALFYPVAVLVGLLVTLFVGVALFEAAVFLRHHPYHRHHHAKTGWRLPL